MAKSNIFEELLTSLRMSGRIKIGEKKERKRREIGEKSERKYDDR